MEEEIDCDTVTHLRWSLAMDWSAVSGGNPLTDGWEARATSWRAGRGGTEEWLTSLTPLQTPSWRALQAAHSAAGLNPEFRRGPASHDSRQYGWYENLERRIIRKLDVDGQNDATPMARAIRGFLDIIHVHPFADGNTRAACTWLAWSLAGAEIDVPDLAPMLQIPKPAGNGLVAQAMAQLL